MPHFRAGFALPLVIAVLALGGMLVTATFLLGRLESQSGANGLRSARAFEAAETGLATTLKNWNPQFDTLPGGGSLVLPSTAVATASWQASLQRLGDDLFLLRSEGAVPISGATWQAGRKLAALVRWSAPLPAPAAVTVVDSVTWAGSGSASGYSVTSAGWPVCPPDSVPALRTAPATVTNLGSCGGPGCLQGAPPILIDSLLAGSVPTAILPLAYAGLAAGASYSPIGAVAAIGPTVIGQPPACDRGNPLNWGEPDHSTSSSCTTLMPVIHASGDLTLNGGRGQGTVLVDGNLVLGGGFEFSGLVVVLGRVTTSAGGAHITGALVAQVLTVPPGHQLSVEYSACVLRKVLRGPSQALPLLYRSWAQLY